MIKLKDILNEVLDDVPRLLYLATFKALLPTIKQSGIISSDSKYRNIGGSERGLYLGDSPEYAASMVEVRENDNIPKEWFDEIVILTIDTSKLNLSKLDSDPDVSPPNWQDEYDDTTPSPDEPIYSFIYRDNIRFSAVVNIKFESKPPTIFIPRRVDSEDRDKRYMVSIQKQIQNYIKNGGVEDLNFGNTPIQSIPDNLKFVDGRLNLFNTKIKSLPDNLTVNGTLDIRHTKLTKLPDNLTADQLYVDDTLLINQLPKNLKVTDVVYINKIDRKRVKRYTEKEFKKLFPNVNKFVYMF